MNPFDLSIIHFLNSFSQRSWMVDHAFKFLAYTDLLKGGVIVAIFWGAWAQPSDVGSKNRGKLLFGLGGSVFAVALARTLAVVLPFRVRPIFVPAIGFRIPYGVDPKMMISWSSFPSDHATVFFCLATSIWIVSRRLGAVALCYSFFVISLPRIYIGIHYPTDIIAGALLGIGVAFLFQATAIRGTLGPRIFDWANRHPSLFYAFLFLFSSELAEQFWTLRQMALLILSYSHFHALLRVLR